MAIAAGLLAAGVVVWAGWLAFGPNTAARQGDSTRVIVGGGLGGVARGLASAGVIRSVVVFEVAAVLTGAARHLKAGEYCIPSHSSLFRILSMVRRGLSVRHVITIPEGLTSAAAADIVRRVPFLLGSVSTPPEGALLPETYEVRRGESREAVMTRMTVAEDHLVGQLWKNRAPGLPYGSPRQAVALASVVEKETALPRERPQIAAVFINRLRKGMRLESDPTVIYGLSRGGPLGRGLRASELASTSPYNTYRVAGLPPTPIANPGTAALEAAMHPAKTDDLFFVADGSGGHAFASTFAAHRRNVARWRLVEHNRSAVSGS
jgi:UPF0755 protein